MPRRLFLATALALLASAPAAPVPAAGARAPLPGLEQYAGRVVYLDFWASWCGPCRHSFPWLGDMVRAHGGEGLTVLAVNLDTERADADGFLARFQPRFDLRFDPQGELARRFGVTAMPTSVLIDRSGHVRYVHKGFTGQDEAGYEQHIRELLAEHPASHPNGSTP